MALSEDYPAPSRSKTPASKNPIDANSLKAIRHELVNIASDITSQCELYILDTEQGFKKGKSEKERLDEAIDVLKSVLKSTQAA